VPTLASFKAEERKGDVDRGQKSGSGSELSPPPMESPDATPLGQTGVAARGGSERRVAAALSSALIRHECRSSLFFFLNLAASAPSASLKPAAAVRPKSAFVPPPASLATMARQSRKIVKQCPPARVAVLGPQGSGRSSLSNLLCSATNTTPNDPRQLKKKKTIGPARAPRAELARLSIARRDQTLIQTRSAPTLSSTERCSDVSTRAHVQRSATAVTTRIKAHALSAQIALVDAGCFTQPPALGAFLEVR